MDPRALLMRARGIERYLDNLGQNPRLRESVPQILAASADCRCLRESQETDPARKREELIRFEAERVDPLLRPLDEEARRIIRNEALTVAVSTALSPVGAADAFLVLWRNANLVTKLANLYYGRPGLLGTLLILRDVSFAVWLAGQMQGIAGAGASLAGNWIGNAAAPVAGPIADGLVNGLVTLRIGYVARARCRAFRAFTEASLANVLKSAFQEAAKQGAGLASDLVRTVGLPVLKLPVEAGRKLVSWVAGLFSRTEEGAGAQQA